MSLRISKCMGVSVCEKSSLQLWKLLLSLAFESDLSLSLCVVQWTQFQSLLPNPGSVSRIFAENITLRFHDLLGQPYSLWEKADTDSLDGHYHPIGYSSHIIKMDCWYHRFVSSLPVLDLLEVISTVFQHSLCSTSYHGNVISIMSYSSKHF